MPRKNLKTTVGVIGLGYVGLPTALALADANIKTIGVDISKKIVDQVNSGKSFIKEIPNKRVKSALKNLHATTDWRQVKKCDVVLITVPTPLNKNKAPDTSAIEIAGEKVAENMKRGTLIILESTTYPGTTDELLLPILESRGKKVGNDFYLAFAPERIDPGNKDYDFKEIPKVVGGVNPASTKKAVMFYKLILKEVFPVSSARTAEMTKLLENIFRLVNISLVNELKMLSAKMGIDFWEVIEAAKTKPYGFTPFYPGPGVGGHCIPLDPFYLSWKAKEYNFFTRFIDLAGEINELMPHHVVTNIIWALNNEEKPVRGSKILVLGVAYKKDIDDSRESPATPIIQDLLRKGGEVIYNDPFVPQLKINGEVLKSKPLTKSLIQMADCVVILTDHSQYDYKEILKNSKLIIDTRNAIKARSPKVIN